MADDSRSNLISILPKQEVKETLFRKANLDLAQRVRELEEEVLRLIDCSLDNVHQIDALRAEVRKQKGFTLKLLHLIQDLGLGPSVSSAATEVPDSVS